MRIKLLLLYFLFSTPLFAIEVKIRLFSTQTFNLVTVTPDTGAYYLIALDGKLRPIDTVLDIFEEEDNRQLLFEKYGRNVRAHKAAQDLGNYNALLIKSKDPRSEFRITAENRHRVYHGDLQLRIYEGHIQVINIVDIEHYVAGVVESEGGRYLNPEYFKAQAVLARTFVLKNWDKHMEDGYNLKDDVSSQVYFSKARHQHAEAIKKAVFSTRDTVVVTHECTPILGVFHANSGGITVGSDHAWLKAIDYLQSKKDSFSVNVGSYEWQKKVPKSEFYDYVSSSMRVENDLHLRKALLNFDQGNKRVSHFEYKGRELKLTRFRNRFNLRSTYFWIEEEGNYVLIKGHGFGHGVGLSQDGAMEMDRRGYNYREILHFYFTGVELECIDNLEVKLR